MAIEEEYIKYQAELMRTIGDFVLNSLIECGLLTAKEMRNILIRKEFYDLRKRGLSKIDAKKQLLTRYFFTENNIKYRLNEETINRILIIE